MTRPECRPGDRTVEAACHGDGDCGVGCRVLTGLEFRGKQALACEAVDFERVALTQSPTAQRAPALAPANTFQLHSRPGNTKVIYLDFDGQVVRNTPWNDASHPTITVTAFDMDSSPASFSATELATIYEIWQRVSECYSPFDVDVTTQAPAVADLINTGGGDTKWGVRMLFGTPTPSPAPGSGGIAYVDAFGMNSGSGVDVPAFVMQPALGTSAKFNADSAVHECGHVLGLSHDGVYPKTDSRHIEYYRGQGTGKVGWAPVMGSGFYVPVVQWSKGEYANPSNTQDDLNIITTHNGFTYRADDFASSQAAAQPIPGTSAPSTFTVNVAGVIETRADTDWFKIVAGAGPISLSAVGGPANSMLDLQLSLYNSAGALVVSANPLDDVIASFSQSVAAGTYFVKVEGVGLGNPLTTGYTDYSSLGQYTLTGSYALVPPSGAPVLGGTNNQFYGATQPPKNINLGITVSDPNSATLASATVTITNVVSAEDILRANLQTATTGNIVGIYNSATGVMTFTSAGATATVAQFQAALRAVTYSNSNANPNLTPRNVQFKVFDGTNFSNISTSIITIGYFHVSAQYDAASNTLNLGDDLGDNSVSISMSAGQVTVTGNGPTRIGTAASSQPSAVFNVGASVNLYCNFTEGSDQITLTGMNCPSAIFNLGNGNDVITVNLSNVGNLRVYGGNGTDALFITGSTITARTVLNVP